MKIKSKVTILIVFTLVLAGFYGANNAIASLGQTAECGGCHNTSGVLILTSNASGTVDAIVGVSFMLVVDASGYTGGDNEFAISLQANWADNNEFDFTAEEIVDGSLSDKNAATNEIQAEYTFTPLTEGTQTIRIWTAAAGDLATSLDVTVSVLVIDVFPP
ncbi:MAG: hypothetical protein P1Q69_14755 [Candidatus Thorarchaeota archaeon]|nr:hypothetical protein [Candidatus Thorarchaeota archaeon]